MDSQQSELHWVNIGGQECIFTTLLNQRNFMKKYLGRKYNFELGTLIKDESYLQLFQERHYSCYHMHIHYIDWLACNNHQKTYFKTNC